MRNSTVILVLILHIQRADADAPRGTYVMRSQGPTVAPLLGRTTLPSCGPAARMYLDEHIDSLIVYGDQVFVNGEPWILKFPLDTVVIIGEGPTSNIRL